jgi:hypothetical protein
MIGNINSVDNLPPVNYGSINKNTKEHNLEIEQQNFKADKNKEIQDYLKSSLLDLNLSDAKIDQTAVNFNLVFTSSSFEKLTAKGSYNFSEKNISLQLSFNFSQKIDEEINKYMLNIEFNSSSNETISTEQTTQKEDIIEYVRKIARNVFETLTQKGKYVAGIQFNEEDIKELLQLDDGKFYKILNEIVSLAINLAKLKHLMKGEPSEGVVLKPERVKWNVIDYKHSFSNQLNLKISLNQVE